MPTNPSLQHLALKNAWRVTEVQRQAHAFPAIFYNMLFERLLLSLHVGV